MHLKLLACTTAGTALAVCLLLLVLTSLSCQPLVPRDAPPAELDLETPPHFDAIPQEYGRLVAVAEGPAGRWVSLWFEQPDGTLTGVWVNTQRGSLDKVLVIPRK